MKRIGFGQVEPNHLSAQRNGQIYAQRKYTGSAEVLENGMFLKYAGEGVAENGTGEWMLVLNEVKLYDDAWRESYKDFAMTEDNGGEMYPRLFKTNIGDIFTTNCFETAGTKGEETSMTTLVVGDVVSPDVNGYLKKVEKASGDESALATALKNEMVWEVIRVYTMPDGISEGVKLQRIK